MPIMQSRRRFLTNAVLAGTAGLGVLGAAGIGGSREALAEPLPETTRLRLFECPITCIAPHWVARDLLYAEGFTDIQYVTWGTQTQNWPPEVLLSGEVDLSISFIPSDLVQIDAGKPVVILAGIHPGCIELFGSNRVGSTPELKVKLLPYCSHGATIRFLSLCSPPMLVLIRRGKSTGLSRIGCRQSKALRRGRSTRL